MPSVRPPLLLQAASLIGVALASAVVLGGCGALLSALQGAMRAPVRERP